jgi:hypothetical protein
MLLATACGELLSGSAPPLEFFNPFTLIFLMMLYGSGAVLVREMVRRWKKSWPAVFLLGMAYGIYEEGIVVRSFFDPGWMDLGLLAEYGRWLGVNWIWVFQLTLFHALVSITIPIMLVELIYPKLREQPWLTRRGITVHALLLGLMMPIGVLFEMQATIWMLGACWLAIGVLWMAARRTPDDARLQPVRVQHAPLGCIYGVGLAGATALLLIWWLMAGVDAFVPGTLFVGFGVVLVLALLLTALDWVRWDERRIWAFAAGVLTFYAVMAIFAELDNPVRPDNTLGMSLVGIAYLFGLWRLRRRVWRRPRPISPAGQSALQWPVPAQYQTH